MATASLPMYDLPEVRAATDDLWRGLAAALTRAGLKQVPAELLRGVPLADHWHDPDLLFSQTCGYPLTHGLRGAVTPVATPAYDVPGCDGATYRSAIVVRAEDPAERLEDLAGRRCAFNSRDSQSGYNTLRRAVAPLSRAGRFFGAVVESGGHGASLEAVAQGRADLAAADSVTYALLDRWSPRQTEGLRILAWSDAAPGLPYVTWAGAGPDTLARLRDGLASVLADEALATTRQALCLKGAEVLPPEAYDKILEMEADAVELGYPEIA